MPIYEYRCKNGHNFEVLQSISDDGVKKCTECGAPVERVFNPIAVHFKGSGFYSTDYGRGGRGAASSDSKGSDSDGAKPAKDSSKSESNSSGSSSSSSESSKPKSAKSD